MSSNDLPPPPRSASGARRVGALPVVAVLVVVALVAAGVTFLLTQGEAEAVVELEPATAAGTDPFTDSVAITEVAEFPDAVRAVATQVRAEGTVEDDTITLVGSTPGLYGGTRDESACDVDQLADFLASSPDKADAWADAAGVDVEQIDDFLATLTPLLLTSDTRVTNHGFSNGIATPRQSVLQAGTAVLVDDTGVPRVRCSCGNPLREPAQDNTAAATVEGARWRGFDPAAAVRVGPGEPVSDFAVVDVADGDTFQVAAATSQDRTDASTTTTPETPSADELVLSGTGLEVVGFGASRAETMQAVSAVLGEPETAATNVDDGLLGQDPDGVFSASCGGWFNPQEPETTPRWREARWGGPVEAVFGSTGFTLYFDLADTFVGWTLTETGPPDATLRTTDGLTLDTTLADLQGPFAGVVQLTGPEEAFYDPAIDEYVGTTADEVYIYLSGTAPVPPDTTPFQLAAGTSFGCGE